MPWTSDDLLAEYGELYHVTFPENVSRILTVGLVCSEASKRGMAPDEYKGLLDAEGVRREPIAIGVGDHKVLLNDQIPMSRGALGRCGLSPEEAADWLRYLDRHVFLWASKKRLARFLYARQQRGYQSTVLRVKTPALLKLGSESVRLSSQNSGAPDRRYSRRHHFIALDQLERPKHWFDSKGNRKPVVEVVLEDYCVPAQVLELMPQSEWDLLLQEESMKQQKRKERARSRKG